MNRTHQKSKTKLFFWRVFTPWNIDKPTALPWGEWAQFDEEQKAKYPIRWFLFDTIPMWWDVTRGRIKRAKWGFKHKYLPRHKYHIVRTSLEPGYYDPDIRILYATMDMVREYVEITRDVVDWTSDPGHEHAWKELQEIYDWWVNEYPNRENELPELPDVDLNKIFRNDDQDDSDTKERKKEWRRISNLQFEAEQQWKEKEKEMLIRVMNIRDYLWYP